ncbi:hypothetical protein U9M48_010091 [Paspalum notatum var. saurae]|uniref:Bifunctional inhibitor/plant lipid transfer protein/seed storage helical domain-containing protein n=1 Tax=Paspalum notatum var. saurae TaxID=547442 RepID=A0AAQ3SSE0_PASNO
MARPRLLDLEVTLALVAVVAAASATLSSAQQMAAPALPFPTLPSCPPAPLSLSPCIGYVFGVGSASLTSCCSQLRTFLQAQAPCLCAASKLAPSPVGLILGQIPNVCDLPNPCDHDAAGESSAPAASTPPVAGDAPPPAATTPAADPDASGAPPAPAEDPSATAAEPAAAETKLPQLLHAAGATSSRGMAAGTVLVGVFLASVATIYV